MPLVRSAERGFRSLHVASGLLLAFACLGAGGGSLARQLLRSGSAEALQRPPFCSLKAPLEPLRRRCCLPALAYTAFPVRAASAAGAGGLLAARKAQAAAEQTSEKTATATYEDQYLPLGRPPRLPEEHAADAGSAKAFDAAKGLLKAEMWRLFKQQQQRKEAGLRMLTEQQVEQLMGFADDYCDSAKLSGKLKAQECVDILMSVYQQSVCCSSHRFSAFNPAKRQPFDFAEWALSVWRPLIDERKSVVRISLKTLSAIEAHVCGGGNIFFLSNHQVEPDPLIVRLMFRLKGFEDIFRNLIAVAGYRVRSDLLSVPFSLSCNMICVHSNRHLAAETSTLASQRLENLAAMQAMLQRLQQGGAVFWVAPSGGRDRPQSNGFFVQPDAFSLKTVQSFKLLANRVEEATQRSTLFCPMALYTAPICPPPKEVMRELGESRRCSFSPIGVATGELLEASLSADELTRLAQQQTFEMYSGLFRTLNPGNFQVNPL